MPFVFYCPANSGGGYIMYNLNHGGDIYSYMEKYNREPIDFSSNINPLGMPEIVKRELMKSINILEKYPDIRNRGLKNAVSEKENIPPDYIFCSNGGSEAVFLTAGALKPKKALIPIPTFGEYEAALYPYGTEIVYYYTKEENGFEIREDILGYIKPEIDIIYLCSPNNPVGNITDIALIEKIISKAVNCSCTVFVDESFMDFAEKGKSSKTMLRENKNLIILKSYTKIYALAGIRAGFLFSSDIEFLNKIERLAPPWNVSAAAAISIESAVKDKSFIKKSIRFIKNERKILMNALQKCEMKVFESDTNYIFFKNTIIQNLGEELEKKGILIRSCSDYTGLNENFFRIAIRTEYENRLFIKAVQDLKTEVR